MTDKMLMAIVSSNQHPYVSETITLNSDNTLTVAVEDAELFEINSKRTMFLYEAMVEQMHEGMTFYKLVDGKTSYYYSNERDFRQCMTEDHEQRTLLADITLVGNGIISRWTPVDSVELLLNARIAETCDVQEVQSKVDEYLKEIGRDAD